MLRVYAILCVFIVGHLLTIKAAEACVGGGYIQLYPLAENHKGQLWTLKLHLGRDGRGTHFSYKSSLILLDTAFNQLDSIGLNKGEYFYSSEERHDLKQCASLADSLYSVAVSTLNKRIPGITYLVLKHASNYGPGHLRLTYAQEVEAGFDDSTGLDTFSALKGFRYHNRHYEINSLKTYFSTNEQNILGWPWTSTPVQGFRVYEGKQASYIVFHLNLMSHANPDSKYKSLEEQNASHWQDQMYQPIGWHHSGMEVLLKFR